LNFKPIKLNFMQDLFEMPELLPTPIKAILSRYNDLEMEKGIQYADLIQKAKEYAKNKQGIFGSSPQIVKRKVLTDKY